MTKAYPARDADGKAEDGGQAVALTATCINQGCRCGFEPKVPGSDRRALSAGRCHGPSRWKPHSWLPMCVIGEDAPFRGFGPDLSP